MKMYRDRDVPIPASQAVPQWRPQPYPQNSSGGFRGGWNGKNPHPHQFRGPRPSPYPTNFIPGGRGPSQGNSGRPPHPYYMKRADFIPPPSGNQHNLPSGQSDSPWMTPEILKLIEEKDELWRINNECKTEESYRNFKIKRIQVNMAVNDAKVLYYQKSPVQAGPWNPNLSRAVSHAAGAYGKTKEFYCGPCDKDFATEELLEEHKGEHITCKLDGCTYTAHVKLVMRHIEMQHSTNLFNRIRGFDTPEDIEKWKEERKKNFPTPENLARKTAEAAERQARGDTITTKDDFPGIEVFRHKIVREEHKPRKPRRFGPGYQSDGDEDVVPHRGAKNNMPSVKSFNKSPAIRLLSYYTDLVVLEDGSISGQSKEVWCGQLDTVQSGCDLASFRPPTEGNKLEDVEDKEEELNITDDEAEADDAVPPVTDLLKTHNEQDSIKKDYVTENSCTIKGLVSYDTDSDPENGNCTDEEGEVKSDTDCIASTNTKAEPQITLPKMDPPLTSDEEGPDEVPAIITKEPESINAQDESERLSKYNLPKRIVQKSCNPRPKFKPRSSQFQRAQSIKRKYSLLQRLLAPDIRREKNMVLQVCRFLVDRNFLGDDTVQCSNE